VKEILLTVAFWFILIGVTSKLWDYGYESYIVPHPELVEKYKEEAN
jgi:hypothetical protein